MLVWSVSKFSNLWFVVCESVPLMRYFFIGVIFNFNMHFLFFKNYILRYLY